MSIESKTTLKGRFEDFDYPTGDDFSNFIDSTHNQDQGIEESFDTAFEIIIPPKIMLYDLVIWVGETQTVKVGNSNGSSEHLSMELEGEGAAHMLDKKIFSFDGQSIWVTGANSINIKYYLK